MTQYESQNDAAAVDYSKRESWTKELLLLTLPEHTVLTTEEKDSFDLLWKAKLKCEDFLGAVIKPRKELEGEKSMKNLLEQIENRRKIICITGGLAEGKTFAMSALAKELQEEMNISNTFSNYGLKFAKTMAKIQYINLYAAEDYTLICIDEGLMVCHSSRPFIAHLFSDFMKNKKIIVMITSFNENRIDKDFRKKINITLNAENQREEQRIRLTGTNVAFERTYEISDENAHYNFLEPTEVYISL